MKYITSISKWFSVVLIMVLVQANMAYSVRIKDIASFKGIRTNQLVGYGLVVGLNGTGDKAGTQFTVQSLVNMMEQMGIRVEQSKVTVKNVAAVMVTAKMPPFSRVGNRLDLVVSSIGDAKSLVGGTLLLTPLKGVDGKVYALGQGPLAVGGYSAGGTGGDVVKNHPLVARITRGATVEREIPVTLDGKSEMTMALHNPDFTTVTRIADAINAAIGVPIADAMDSGTVKLKIPNFFQNQIPKFIADIETLEVEPDMVAKIIVNEKTGTVVIGENVRISTVAIAHGNLNITIQESDQVSQPTPFSQGQTVITPQTNVAVQEEKNNVIVVPSGSTIGDLVRALNAIGVSPRDMISIFQSIKAAGALQAELEII